MSKLKLLIRELLVRGGNDSYIRENFRRIEAYLESLEAGITNITNNNTTVTGVTLQDVLDAAIDATTGVPDAGKLVKTEALGKIDSSFLPPLGGGGSVERFTLNATQITNKQVTLSNTPSVPADVIVDTPNGPTQNYNQDYIVSGSVVSWNGYGLETILEEGDILIIIYS